MTRESNCDDRGHCPPLLELLEHTTTDWWLKQQKSVTVLEAGKSSLKALADLVSGGTHFLIHRQPSFDCILTWQKRKASHGASLIRALTSLVSAPCS